MSEDMEDRTTAVDFMADGHGGSTVMTEGVTFEPSEEVPVHVYQVQDGIVDDHESHADCGPSNDGLLESKANESCSESVDELQASEKNSAKKRSALRPVLKCPHCEYTATVEARFIAHLTEHYAKDSDSKCFEGDDHTVQATTRRRTRSQDMCLATTATATTTTTTTATTMSAVRSIATRSKTIAVATAVAISAEIKTDEPGEDQDQEQEEEKKRLRAQYQRNYRRARKLIKCSQCCYETRDPTAMKAHRATHAAPDTRQIACDKCQKTFLTLQALRFHERTKCGQERRYTCDFCGHRTLHRETWRQHLANIHKRDTRGNALGDIKCTQCDYVCCARHQLQLHMLRKHTVDKPFKCDKCEYAAVRRSELAKHVSIQHLKERNFMCDVCGFRSQTSNGLYSHVRSKHSGIKLYRCDLCGKEYNCHTSFKVHKQKHTGDVKLYVCHVCGHSCNKRTNLRSHMRRIHSVELESLKKNYAPRQYPQSIVEPECEQPILAETKTEQPSDVSISVTVDMPENDRIKNEIGSEFCADTTVVDFVNCTQLAPDTSMIAAAGVDMLGSMFTRIVAGNEPVPQM